MSRPRFDHRARPFATENWLANILDEAEQYAEDEELEDEAEDLAPVRGPVRGRGRGRFNQVEDIPVARGRGRGRARGRGRGQRGHQGQRHRAGSEIILRPAQGYPVQQHQQRRPTYRDAIMQSFRRAFGPDRDLDESSTSGSTQFFSFPGNDDRASTVDSEGSYTSNFLRSYRGETKTYYLTKLQLNLDNAALGKITIFNICNLILRSFFADLTYFWFGSVLNLF